MNRVCRTHHVCVDCQVSFKRPDRSIPSVCPYCLIQMKNFGTKFKPPKKSNDKQWKKIRLWLESPCQVPFWNIGSYSEAKRVHKDTCEKFKEDNRLKWILKYGSRKGTPCSCGMKI